MDFLNLTSICSTNQFGFRNLHSTNHALLITITEKIRKAIDNGEITCGVFLDLQKKGFDTVGHEILLSKIELGVQGVPLKQFQTFLTQRHQWYVSIKNSISETLTNKHGVPQGSVIYINDLHQVTRHAEIHHFANDTNLLYSSKSLKDINQKINFELKNIVHWLRANKIFCISSFEKAALLPKSYKIQLAFLLFLVALDQLVTPSVLHFSEHLHLIERRKSFGTHL